MASEFYKYQGAGNDFVMIDDRAELFDHNNAKLIESLCDRRFGIGADGLILIREDETGQTDFRMIYFNSDGKEATFCGNGARCSAAFARRLGITDVYVRFMAADGFHQADCGDKGVALKMTDVTGIQEAEGFYVLNTGTPHCVVFKNDLDNINVFEEGRQIRYAPRFEPTGANANFVEEKEGKLFIRTYEKGVEAETLACGTGAVAAALCHFRRNPGLGSVPVQARGGLLGVTADYDAETGGFTGIWLEGPAEMVFKGSVEC